MNLKKRGIAEIEDTPTTGTASGNTENEDNAASTATQCREPANTSTAQAEEICRFGGEVTVYARLFGNQQSRPSAPVIRNKSFTGIKVYDKDPQTYYGHDHFKYDRYEYGMEKIFRSNKELEDARDPKEHKVAFSTFWLERSAATV